jgi:hypothetical protein
MDFLVNKTFFCFLKYYLLIVENSKNYREAKSKTGQKPQSTKFKPTEASF